MTTRDEARGLARIALADLDATPLEKRFAKVILALLNNQDEHLAPAQPSSTPEETQP